MAAASCITSPSAITAAAVDRMSSASQRADLDHHLEGLAEQEIADQHARLVAPHHARRELAAPHVALVDHVVVEQRRRVHELDAGGELDMAVAVVAATARRSRASASAAAACRRRRSGGWRPPGSSSTSEPVRDRIIALTRSMSGRHERDERLDAPARVRMLVLERNDDAHVRSFPWPAACARLKSCGTVTWRARSRKARLPQQGLATGWRRTTPSTWNPQPDGRTDPDQ